MLLQLSKSGGNLPAALLRQSVIFLRMIHVTLFTPGSLHVLNESARNY